MVNELTREAILELVPPCGCIEGGWDDERRCAHHIVVWLLEELAKPREERRDYLGRGL